MIHNKKENTYEARWIKSDYLNYKELKWKKENKNYQGVGKFKADIRHTMSDQLWVEIPYESTETIMDLMKLK